MGKAILAFVIWGCPGVLLRGWGAHPILMALSRYVFAGVILGIAGLVVARGARASSLRLRDRDLWISSALLLARNVFYMLSFAYGPAVVGGLLCGYVPMLLPIFARTLGVEKNTLGRAQLLGLAASFIGNFLIFKDVSFETAEMGKSLMFGIGAAACYLMTPIYSARLQSRGMTPWGLLRAQFLIAAVLSVPAFLVFAYFGMMPPMDTPQAQTTLWLSGVVATLFTILPFYLWYSSIRTTGVSGISIAGFAEPLTAALFSFFVLRDTPLTASSRYGMLLLLAGIGLSALRVGQRQREQLPALARSLASMPRLLKYFKVVGLQMIVAPFAYPVLTALAFNVSWQNVAAYYLSLPVTVLNVYGLLVSWALWNYENRARPLLSLYAAGLCVTTFLWSARLEPRAVPASIVFAALASLLMAGPALSLLYLLRPRAKTESHAGARLLRAGGAVASVSLADFSSTGCRFKLPIGQAGPEVGERVTLEFEAGLAIAAAVMRTIPGEQLEVGAQFEFADEAQRAKLMAFLGASAGRAA